MRQNKAILATVEGFENFDAVDGSQAMLDKLSEKNIYGKAYHAILGNKLAKICPEIEDGAYDVAIIMGGFAQSHLPNECLYQVILTASRVTLKFPRAKII